MGQPAARVGDMTVTGDPVTGPGVATVLIGGMPAAVIGDMVSGATLIGALAVVTSTTLISGRPAARVGDTATGAHAITGVPLASPVAPPGCPTVMIG